MSIPHAITLAARHLITPHASKIPTTAFSRSAAGERQLEVASSGQQVSTDQQAAAPSSTQDTSVVITMMMHAATRPLAPYSPASAASSSDRSTHSTHPNPPAESAQPTHAACDGTANLGVDNWAAAFAANLLTVPDFVAQLSPASHAQLTTASTLSRLLIVLKQLADPTARSEADRASTACRGSPTAVQPTHSSSHRNDQASDLSDAMLQSPVQAILALGNMVQLLACGAVSRSPKVGLVIKLAVPCE